MKDQAKTLWDWMLNKGLFITALLLNFLSLILVTITMFFVSWFTKH